MSQLRFVSASLASAAFWFAALAAQPAHALTDCKVDADCGTGFECTVVGSSGCAGAAPPCEPGRECTVPEPAPCLTTVLKACTPAQCTSDAQCAEGMVCHAWERGCDAVSDCACSSDVPDCDCGPAPACQPETVSYCTPRYLLPCQQAADCGEGFSCEQQERCSCSGGGAGERPAPEPDFAPPGTGGGSSGAPLPYPDPVPEEPSCSCEPSGVFACVPREMECDSAADCPAGWVCEQGAQATLPGCAGERCPEPEPLPPARRLCQPEYYGGGGGVALDEAGNPSSGEAPPRSDGLSGPGSGNAPQAESGSDGQSQSSAACQMGRGPASGGALSLLAALGALFGLKRRRAR